MESATLPNYSYVFKFEEDFDTPGQREWMRDNWKSCFYYVGIYMLVVFGGKLYMSSRSRFTLTTPLVIWNLFLATFSIWGAIRTIPELFYVLNEYGFHYSACIPGPSFLENKVGALWIWLFTLSKVPELGDTVFIVLRKQPLIFLHWYHHVTVLLYSWYSYSDYIATARWFISMNYFVHSIMYTYFALKALKFKIPKIVSICITTAQLLQMVIGLSVNLWAYQVKISGNECHVSWENIKVSLLMYASYFVLFARFFVRAYVTKNIVSKKNSDSKYFYIISNGVKED